MFSIKKSSFFWLFSIFFLIALIYTLIVVVQGKTLRNIKNFELQTIEIQKNLTQNRISLFEYSKLDTNSSLFATKSNSLLNSINLTNTALIEETTVFKINKLKVLNPFKWLKTWKINKKYKDTLSAINTNMLTQKDNLVKINKYNGIVHNIYIYDPYSDLGNDIRASNFPNLIEKSSRAKMGLITVLDNLKANGLGSEEVIRNIELNISRFERLEFFARNRNGNSYNETYESMVQDFNKLKNIVYKEELNLMFSASQVEVITKETNDLATLVYINEELDNFRKDIVKGLLIKIDRLEY